MILLFNRKDGNNFVRYDIICKAAAAVGVAAVLAFAFFWGSDAPKSGESQLRPAENAEISETHTPKPSHSEAPSEKPSEKPTEKPSEKPSSTAVAKAVKATAQPQQVTEQPHTAEPTSNEDNHHDQAPQEQFGTETEIFSGSQAEEIPPPMSGDTEASDKALTCTMSVTCGEILGRMPQLAPEKRSLIPEDGVIFKESTVSFYEGESVFNLLVREMKKNKIHLEFVNTPAYGSAYIEGIANIYEFDCGELSGWTYRVNGVFPNYGCSKYRLKEGDRVEWIYTCDLTKPVQ